jgi:zinc transporter ZupT
MNMLAAIWCLTTLIALAAVLWAGYAPWQRRVLPWTAGVLLGIGAFWILPEMAVARGWAPTAAGVFGILMLLGWIDRYVYPICPFCAAGMHTHKPGEPAAHCGRAVGLGWPLLAFGCLHVFFDGWTIALSHVAALANSASALSWGTTIHKIPESVAIGVLAARLTPSRRAAVGAVASIQLVMAAGGALALFAGRLDSRWAGMSTMPACAFLLLFGLLGLQQEWRMHGRALAMRAAAPGVLGCGIAALVTTILVR